MTADSPTSIDARLQPEFASAWYELGLRINKGLDSLRASMDEAEGVERDRLLWKRVGLDDALTIYDHLNDQVRGGRCDGDFAGAWRTFTDSVFSAYGSIQPGVPAAHKQGLALALEYQRGYADFIDAPPLDRLLTTRALGRALATAQQAHSQVASDTPYVFHPLSQLQDLRIDPTV